MQKDNSKIIGFYAIKGKTDNETIYCYIEEVNGKASYKFTKDKSLAAVKLAKYCNDSKYNKLNFKTKLADDDKFNINLKNSKELFKTINLNHTNRINLSTMKKDLKEWKKENIDEEAIKTAVDSKKLGIKNLKVNKKALKRFTKRFVIVGLAAALVVGVGSKITKIFNPYNNSKTEDSNKIYPEPDPERITDYANEEERNMYKHVDNKEKDKDKDKAKENKAKKDENKTKKSTSNNKAVKASTTNASNQTVEPVTYASSNSNSASGGTDYSASGSVNNSSNNTTTNTNSNSNSNNTSTGNGNFQDPNKTIDDVKVPETPSLNNKDDKYDNVIEEEDSTLQEDNQDQQEWGDFDQVIDVEPSVDDEIEDTYDENEEFSKDEVDLDDKFVGNEDAINDEGISYDDSTVVDDLPSPEENASLNGYETSEIDQEKLAQENQSPVEVPTIQEEPAVNQTAVEVVPTTQEVNPEALANSIVTAMENGQDLSYNPTTNQVSVVEETNSNSYTK